MDRRRCTRSHSSNRKEEATVGGHQIGYILELEVLFGREHTLLSRLRYHLIERLYGQHSWLMIDNMDYFVGRFPLHDEKNLNRVIPPIPEGVRRVVSFTDCHVIQICRPEYNENIHNSVYNGMNRVHTTDGPEGILHNLGVTACQRNNRICLRNGRINTKLENAQNDRGVPALQQGITYADKGA